MASGLFNLKQVNQAISQGAWSGYIAPRWVEYLVVAGGGSGGNNGGGGGGAGGLLTGIVTVTTGASYTVTVGAGGATQSSNATNGNAGSVSVFGSISSVGGAGGGNVAGGLTSVGGSGGGGGSGNNSNYSGGQGTFGQGNAGGLGFASVFCSGGGGGAGTLGLAGVSTIAGNGGAGIASAISGTITTYAGGGGGSGTATGGTFGAGGVGGGGRGDDGASTPGAGASNTGGGGGGLCNARAGSPSGAGGSGIVVVRYPGNVQFYTGGTVTYSNGYIVHNFIANGTLAPTTPTVVSEYQISRSLRFNSADSAYLTRGFSSGNRKTFTWSAWIKKTTLDVNNTIYSAETNTSNQFWIALGLANTLIVYDFQGAYNLSLTSTPLYRDFSAWYHIVVAVDTTQATSTNRAKVYVNGLEITVTGAYPTQNYDTMVNNSASTAALGRSTADGRYLNSYMTEVNFIDGQALTPTSFGYVNPTTGIWSPAKYVGGYGTNGFYLNFSDNSNTTAATLGADYSGNGNNWTPNNFSVTAGAGNDSMVDSPTSYGTDTGVGGTVRGNYATFNPLIKVVSQPTLSNGNLLSTAPAGWSSAVGTIGVTSGKWYWEIVNGNSDAFVGICGDNATLGTDAPQSSTGTILYYGNTGNKRIDTVDTGYGSTFSTQTIGVALDIDGGTIVFYRDNVSQGSISLSSSTLNGRTIFPLSGVISTTATVNFGQRAFAYTAPSGFKALCTQNLPTPTIGATSATLATQFFGAATYTGNGDLQSVTVGFQPDWVWLKSRSVARNHRLMDTVRGINYVLSSDLTTAEYAGSALSSINSSGFTLNSTDNQNVSSETYVAWNWRASNATAVTNTAGSITSTVSANTTSGFSVLTYTGTGANATVGHGLGVAPSMLIIKRRDSTSNWLVYQISLGNTKGLVLNATQAESTDSTYWNNTSPTSSVFSLGSGGAANASSGTMVAYCFAAIAGYSAFGSYTGNGSTDGTFVFTGFRPAYVMIKSSSATTDWIVYDAVRNTYNVTDLNLRPNTSDAESSQAANYIDLLSNGFKLRGDGSGSINASGATYIYMAFATSPFKYSLAR